MGKFWDRLLRRIPPSPPAQHPADVASAAPEADAPGWTPSERDADESAETPPTEADVPAINADSEISADTTTATEATIIPQARPTLAEVAEVSEGAELPQPAASSMPAEVAGLPEARAAIVERAAIEHAAPCDDSADTGERQASVASTLTGEDAVSPAIEEPRIEPSDDVAISDVAADATDEDDAALAVLAEEEENAPPELPPGRPLKRNETPDIETPLVLWDRAADGRLVVRHVACVEVHWYGHTPFFLVIPYDRRHSPEGCVRTVADAEHLRVAPAETPPRRSRASSRTRTQR